MQPDIRRLKATWIVDLMDRYVPDAFICHAAGIETLKRFESFRPDLRDKDLVAVRGAVSWTRTWRGAAGGLGGESDVVLGHPSYELVMDCFASA